MDISSIASNSIGSLTSNQASKANLVNQTQDNSFAQLLNNAVTELNDSQLEGYNAMEGIATGKVQNLQEAVQRIEEAELSLKLALEVKNKALAAFKEVGSMQV